jgi:hypothetical protein
VTPGSSGNPVDSISVDRDKRSGECSAWAAHVVGSGNSVNMTLSDFAALNDLFGGTLGRAERLL